MSYFRFFAVLVISFSAFLFSVAQNIPSRIIAANDPNVRYVGRIFTSDNNAVSFDWTGTYFETRFTGDYLAMKVSDTKKNYYNVFVDNKFTKVISTQGKDRLVVLAEGLKKGEHTIRLQKRTEAEQGRTTIHHFEVANSGSLLSMKSISSRHIEFIGNSLTCGYGTEGKSKDEKFLPETENCNLAYACMLARYFDADYTLIAHSGQGAVRNWGDSVQVSACTMKDRMMRTFDEDGSVFWNFAKSPYKPNIVLINLGTNDFSPHNKPTYEQFSTAYKQIVQQIRNAYGRVPILCIAPRTEAPCYDYIKSVCDEISSDNVHFVGLFSNITNWHSDLGSNYHPNHEGQRKMAMAVLPYIATITGWGLQSKVLE